MKIFISMSMNGRSDAEIEADMNKYFDIIKKDLIENGELKEDETVTLIDTIHHDNMPANPDRLWYLGSSIQKMADADIVYFAGDWFKAKGCWVEYVAALKYNKSMVYDYPSYVHRNRIEAVTRDLDALERMPSTEESND